MPSPEASRRNLQKARNMGRVVLRRGRDETALIKLLIWQRCFDSGRRPSQRALARLLGVSQPYICKVMRKAVSVGWDALIRERRLPTLADLEHARGVTARMRERAPDLFRAAPTTASDQAEPQRANPYRVMAEARTVQEWEELERRSRRRLLFRVR